MHQILFFLALTVCAHTASLLVLTREKTVHSVKFFSIFTETPSWPLNFDEFLLQQHYQRVNRQYHTKFLSYNNYLSHVSRYHVSVSTKTNFISQGSIKTYFIYQTSRHRVQVSDKTFFTSRKLTLAKQANWKHKHLSVGEFQSLFIFTNNFFRSNIIPQK